MPDFTVTRVGSDTSGRALFMTRYAWRVWRAALAQPEIAPFAENVVIVQGAFMTRAGGGASASAGYHDLAGCWDIRTWNLTTKQIDILIRALRKAGIAAWRRDLSSLHGGMDPHIHVTFGDDRPLTSGAADSWSGYLRNQNGLANDRPDYEWRPSPLVTTPPASLFKEDYMATDAGKAQLTRIEKAVTAVQKDLDRLQTAESRRYKADAAKNSARYKALVSKLGGLADQLAGEDRAKVLALLSDEEDVTGEDNPA